MFLGAQSGIRKKHEEYADEVVKDHVLRNTCKKGPPDSPNRPTKPRHRPFDIRTHQAMYQRKTVARGGTRGSAVPTWQPNTMNFGGKADLILTMAVWHVSIQGDGRYRPLKL